MFNLPPPRHISTLPLATVGPKKAACREGPLPEVGQQSVLPYYAGLA